MIVDSVEFAKHIINRLNAYKNSADEPVSFGETKLHKLLYICDGYLLSTGRNIIKENARAWNYGPVYPRLHSWLNKNPDAFTQTHGVSLDALAENEPDVTALVDTVIRTFGRWTANDLSNWSHSPGSPWETALEKGNGIMNSVIDKNDMKKYFKRLVGEYEKVP